MSFCAVSPGHVNTRSAGQCKHNVSGQRTWTRLIRFRATTTRYRPASSKIYAERGPGRDITEELKQQLEDEDTAATSNTSERERAPVTSATNERPAATLKGLTNPRKRQKTAETTDWISSGLAWLGFLAFGVVSEQIKTRLEERSEREGTQEVADAEEVVTESRLRYKDIRKGGGANVQKGYLIVLDLRVTDLQGRVLLDTKQTGRPIVATSGGRPFTGGLCKGAEEALASMKAGGVRQARIPAALAFGSQGATLRPGDADPDNSGNVPPDTDLEYRIELLRVSIPPS